MNSSGPLVAVEFISTPDQGKDKLCHYQNVFGVYIRIPYEKARSAWLPTGRYAMKSLIQLFLLVQFAVFVFAASAHLGLFGGRDDLGAGTAETVIAVALLAGLTLTFTRGADVRSVALAAQGFALLGTLIGITLVLTVGPTKTFDVTVHAVMLALLIAGLLVTYRAPRELERASSA